MSGIPVGAQFVFFDGCRFTPSMLADFQRMDAAFYAEFGLHLLASSAIRFKSEQTEIFLKRYVPATQVAGRRVYDFRWWKGVLWARISPDGTVAAPDSPQANHVVENTGSGAVDIRDSGADAGVMTAGTVRAKWLRENAHRFNFIPEGYSFGEPWHYKYVGNLWAAAAGVGPVTPGPSTTPPATHGPEEDDMGFYFRTGPQATIYFWNESRGRAREVSKEEQAWRAAVAKTAGGAPQKIVTVSAMWQQKALALGLYAAG